MKACVLFWKGESRSGIISNVKQECSSVGGTRILRVIHVRSARATLQYLSLPLAIFLLAQMVLTPVSFAQRRGVSRNGAHSSAAREAFTPADRRLVERAVGQTCAERIRDPFGSMPIDEMQARPSLPVGHPDAVAGLRRAERVLPATRRLVVRAIVQLAKE